MKRVFICIAFLCAVGGAQAQTKRAAKPLKKAEAARQQKKAPAKKTARPDSTVSISSVSSYNAMAPRTGSGTLSISDPTINALNARAAGGNVTIGSSGVPGMPKRAYGFANGRLMLHNSTGTSSGTITGSGLVGTGSSQGNIGSTGPSLGVNGKSPYGGSAMWGNARNLWIRPDSSLRIRSDH